GAVNVAAGVPYHASMMYARNISSFLTHLIKDQKMNLNLEDEIVRETLLTRFIGFEVIRRVSPLLHTPLMSLTNALDAIAVVGAIVLVGEHKSQLAAIFGFIAVVAATSNIVGGFLITDRMLKMFKSSRPAAKS